jgi:hypothetical protein
MPVLLRRKSVNHFIQRPIAAARNHKLPSLGSGALRHRGRIARRRRFVQLGFNPTLRQNPPRLLEHAPAPGPAVPGVRVMYQQSVAKI